MNLPPSLPADGFCRICVPSLWLVPDYWWTSYLNFLTLPHQKQYYCYCPNIPHACYREELTNKLWPDLHELTDLLVCTRVFRVRFRYPRYRNQQMGDWEDDSGVQRTKAPFLAPAWQLTIICNSSSRGFNPSSNLWGHQACMQCASIHVDKIVINME